MNYKLIHKYWVVSWLLIIVSIMTGRAEADFSSGPTPPPGISRSGAVVANHLAVWNNNASIKDGGSATAGSGTAGQVTLWSGTNAVTGDTTFTYTGSAGALNIGIGMNGVTPDSKLHILNTSAGVVTNSFAIGNASTTTGTGTRLNFNLTTTANNYATIIEGVRTNSPAAGSTELNFYNAVNGGSPIKTATMNSAGHFVQGGSAPALATGATDCGTTPAIVGNDNVGRVTVGSGANGGKCTLTFAVAWAHNAICVVEDETTAILVRPVASTTTLAITGVIVAGDTLTYRCGDYF